MGFEWRFIGREFCLRVQKKLAELGILYLIESRRTSTKEYVMKTHSLTYL
jgi:hypothetical protein